MRNIHNLEGRTLKKKIRVLHFETSSPINNTIKQKQRVIA